MLRSRRSQITALVAAAATVVAAPAVAAQDDDGSTTTTTTTVAPATSTSTTVPGGGPPTSTTTTTVYLPPVPPDLAGDPRLPILVDPGPGDGIDVPEDQAPFDPGTATVLPERVAAAEEALELATGALLELQRTIATQSAEVRRLGERVEQLDEEVRAAVRAAAQARRALRDHAVRAYMVGPVEDQLALLNSADAVDMGVAKSFLDAVAATRQRLVRDYDRARKGLRADHARLAAELGEADSRLAGSTAELPGAFDAVRRASEELAAYEAGAHAYVDGFVFPVAGDVEFIDSWGFPRMLGTASAHWHQGSDIFAAFGTPLLATEDGVLTRVGTASLGGNKLWLVGESGHHYYYAHLSAYAPGVRDGLRVEAGDVVGFVGDTGNAKGTSPHLHFEIHPGGKGPVNPYPLLKAAYGSRPMVPVVVPPPTPAPAGSPTAAPASPGG